MTEHPAVSAPPVPQPRGPDVAAIEGVDDSGSPWGDYPLDDLQIRRDNRTILDVVRRIRDGWYVMEPDFQQDFIWKPDRQSKLIESVMLRLPLPALYLAEDEEGRVVVVDGLQRLSTFLAFLEDRLPLHLPEREELNGKSFSDLPAKLQNRIEDCNLILYVIDSEVPDRVKLDIFGRVNSGEPLSRQQMRNCLFAGKGTEFMRAEANSTVFRTATGHSLNSDAMRDREFINRFCAFALLSLDEYRGDMDGFLATALRQMNEMEDDRLSALSVQLRQGLTNNYAVFGANAFRRFWTGQTRLSVLNASLWDVMVTGLSQYSRDLVTERDQILRDGVQGLLEDTDSWSRSHVARTIPSASDTVLGLRGRCLKKSWDDCEGDGPADLAHPRAGRLTANILGVERHREPV